MDYEGFEKSRRYKVSRALETKEKERRFSLNGEIDVKSNDFLSVIKANCTYLELVDRWYSIKGFWAWVGASLSSLSLIGFGIVVWAFFSAPVKTGDRWILWAMLILLGPLFVLLAKVCFKGVVEECFRWTHYPMRLNRKTRQVHVFRQDGSVLTTAWDDLFVFLGEANAPPLGQTWDLRAHVLADDRETVIETFSLGYVFLGNEASIAEFWEFIRRYMEEPDGVEKTHKQIAFCMPVHDRKEGFLFGVIKTFIFGIHWPLMQLVSAPAVANIAWGRLLAMSTSKIPQWPEEIEAACVVDDDDPFQKDWRDNPAFTPFQIIWPLLCFFLGLGAVGYIIWSVLSLL